MHSDFTIRTYKPELQFNDITLKSKIVDSPDIFTAQEKTKLALHHLHMYIYDLDRLVNIIMIRAVCFYIKKMTTTKLYNNTKIKRPIWKVFLQIRLRNYIHYNFSLFRHTFMPYSFVYYMPSTMMPNKFKRNVLNVYAQVCAMHISMLYITSWLNYFEKQNLYRTLKIIILNRVQMMGGTHITTLRFFFTS